MPTIRQAAVAGSFYPGDPLILEKTIQDMLSHAHGKPLRPKAIIAPHAGYIYSGSTAACVYTLLTTLRDTITRVVLLGPCHRVPLSGLATSSADYFSTPLGQIPIDRLAVESVNALAQVTEFDATHEQEHSLEVQLPFLQQVLNEFSLIPLVVGDATAVQVSEVLELLWGGDETLIVISSDLSHFLDYQSAQNIDRKTCEAIEHLEVNSLDYDQACGRNPLNGLLLSAQKHHLKVTTLDLCNSGDTAGDKHSVVGYGAWALCE